jgi:hypothetical protein
VQESTITACRSRRPVVGNEDIVRALRDAHAFQKSIAPLLLTRRAHANSRTSATNERPMNSEPGRHESPAKQVVHGHFRPA